MSIDTLLEAARYLEWQAQQQQIAREEEQRREEELLSKEESRRMEVATTLSAQPIRANHVVWGDGHHRPQPQLPQPQQQQQQPRHPSPAPPVPHPPPLPSLLPSQVPITVIPMVPVVTASPLPITAAPMAVATAVRSSAPTKNGHHAASSPPQQQPAPRHLLCAPQVKVEPVSPPLLTGGTKPAPNMQPQVQIPYASPVAAAAAPGSQHALLPQQAQPPASSPQPRTNGLTLTAEDIRNIDGKRRPGGAGTREVHNKLEKNRRAHLKECFETLKKNVPNVDEKKTSNLSVLRSALRYIQTLKRKEKEYEHEMERLAREKIATQQRLAELKKELSQCMDITEIDRVLRQTVQPEDDQASTSTASEGEDNFDQDIEEDAPSTPRPPPSLPKPIAPLLQAAPPLLAPHLSIQRAAATLPLSGVLTAAPSPATTGGPSSSSSAPQPIAPAPPAPPPPPASTVTLVAPPPPPATMQVQPTVIAHHHHHAAAVSHASVIQAVNHAALPPAAGHKHLTHIAPSPGPASSSSPSPSSSSVVVPHQAVAVAAAPTPLAVTPAAAHHHHHHHHHHPIAAQPIGHITVHPVAHLGGLYPQGAVAVSQQQPTVVGHITHTFTRLPHVHAAAHAATQMTAAVMSQGGGGGGGQSLGKPTAVLAPHPQLVGQTAVLNPVTMVTVPPFPVSTLKLA